MHANWRCLWSGQVRSRPSEKVHSSSYASWIWALLESPVPSEPRAATDSSYYSSQSVSPQHGTPFPTRIQGGKLGRHGNLCDIHFLSWSNWESTYDVSFNSEYLGTSKYFVYFMVITIYPFGIWHCRLNSCLRHELWENLSDSRDS